MNQDIIYDVYLMPGMAANPKIFEFIKLPSNFKVHHLEWQMPCKNELMSWWQRKNFNWIQKWSY